MRYMVPCFFTPARVPLFYIPPFLYTHGGCVYKKYQRLRDEGLLCVLFFFCAVAREKQTVLESFLSMRPRWLKNIAVHNIYNGIVEILHRQGKKIRKWNSKPPSLFSLSRVNNNQALKRKGAVVILSAAAVNLYKYNDGKKSDFFFFFHPTSSVFDFVNFQTSTHSSSCVRRHKYKRRHRWLVTWVAEPNWKGFCTRHHNPKKVGNFFFWSRQKQLVPADIHTRPERDIEISSSTCVWPA